MKQLIIYCLAFMPLTSSICGQEAGGASPLTSVHDPAATRELIRQWVKTERIISEEKTSWDVEKKRMQELLDLYQKELKLLDEEIDKAGKSASMVDENKQRFQTELKQYREAQQLLGDTMARLLPRLKSLMARLPQPLLDELSAEINLLNSEDALGKPRDVLKSMVAVLSASGRFNRSITIAEDTRQTPDGKKMTVDVLYLGLCRAFYTTAAGSTAGVGTPGETGWEWQPVADLADDIRRTIAVYRKDKQPQLIKLPVKISGNENK